MKIHFICLGNVFRSRVAETYLRSLGISGIQVSSSGTVARRDHGINQPILQQVDKVLAQHDLNQYLPLQSCVQTDQQVVDGCDLVICMDRVALNEYSGIVMPSHLRV